MMSQKQLKLDIQEVIQVMMDRIMEKVLYTDPFIPENHRAAKPLYAALVPDEIFKGSHFERRFVTPFGGAWEKLAVVAAKHGMGFGVLHHEIIGNIKIGRIQRISEVLNRLEHRERGKDRVKPDWDDELKYILAGKGKLLPVKVICDVYVEDRKNEKRYSFEIKAPLPNSDQTKVSKEKMFKLFCMEPSQVDSAYFALPYNPYGRREDYEWEFPKRWFDMKHDKVVLIGNEFWDKIGGVGAYYAFINAVNELGQDYKDRIYREYLRIEPPIREIDGKL